MDSRTNALRVSCVALFLLAAFGGTTRGGSVSIQESTYRVYGMVYGVEMWSGVPHRLSYDESSGMPIINEGVSYVDPAQVLQLESRATADSFFVTARAESLGIVGNGSANAEATWRFTWTSPGSLAAVTLEYKDMPFYFTVGGGFSCSRGRASLTDVTTGLTVFKTGSFGTGLFAQSADRYSPEADIPGWEPMQDPYWETFDVMLDPAHLYEFTISGSADSSMPVPPWMGMQVRADIETIPAPAGIFLGIIGMGAVPWLRKRRAI